MEGNLEIIGAESQVIYFNLNNQFSNIKKIIITSPIILDSFEEEGVKKSFEDLKTSNPENYSEILEQIKVDNVLDSPLKNELYKVIQDKLNSITGTGMDIQLKDYNFMNSVSNSKFTITLRTEDFSISKFYQEKGTILSGIRNLVEKYINFKGNAFRLNRIDNFQIEIYESEEIFKRIFLKKEGSSLILTSSFGFDYDDPIDHNTGQEIYFSKDENFTLYNNSQQRAHIRDHSKLTDSEIHTQEKILSDENLVLVNNNTKNINDAIIEMYLTKKGNLRIVNLSVLENSLSNGTENGFMINKSNKNYDKISLIGLRDNLDEDLSNPKYLLIRNSNEIKEFLKEINLIKSVDGIVFCENFYHPFIDYLGASLDIDVVYHKGCLAKSLEVKFDSNEVIIGTEENKVDTANPFSNIIEETSKEKDEFLEKLKSIDLNTPSEPVEREAPKPQGMENIDTIAQSIISSPNSSTAKPQNPNTFSAADTPNPNFGQKKSAIGMLMDSVMNTPSREEQRPEPTPAPPSPGPQMPVETIQQTPAPLNELESNTNISDSSLVMNDVKKEEVSSVDFSGFENATESAPPMPPKSSHEHQFGDLGLETTPSIPKPEKVPESNSSGVKIITTPSVESGVYFADSSNISQVNGGEIYFMTPTAENLSNPNIKYVLPISTYSNEIASHYFLINGPNDFFHIEPNSNTKYFVNLSYAEEDIKEKFLQKCINTLGNLNLIILKKDLAMVSNHLDNINSVFVKDLSSNQDLVEANSFLNPNSSSPNNSNGNNSGNSFY